MNNVESIDNGMKMCGFHNCHYCNNTIDVGHNSYPFAYSKCCDECNNIYVSSCKAMIKRKDYTSMRILVHYGYKFHNDFYCHCNCNYDCNYDCDCDLIFDCKCDYVNTPFSIIN